MNLYLIVRTDLDTFCCDESRMESYVIADDTEGEAIQHTLFSVNKNDYAFSDKTPIKVTLLGVAAEGIEKGVIVEDFFRGEYLG